MTDFEDVKWESGDEQDTDEQDVATSSQPLKVLAPKKKPAPKVPKITFLADDYEICLLRHQLDYEKQAKSLYELASKVTCNEAIGSQLVALSRQNIPVIAGHGGILLDQLREIVVWFNSVFKVASNRDGEPIPQPKKRKQHNPLATVLENRSGSASELYQLFLILLYSLSVTARLVGTIDPESFSPQDHEDIFHSRKEFQDRVKMEMERYITGGCSSSSSSASKPISLIEDDCEDVAEGVKPPVRKAAVPKKKCDFLCWAEVYVSEKKVVDLEANHGEGDKAAPSKGSKSKASKTRTAAVASESELSGRWVSVDLVQYQLDAPEEVEKTLRKGVTVAYALAVDSSGCLADVTPRYKFNYPFMRQQDKHSQSHMAGWIRSFTAEWNSGVADSDSVVDLCDGDSVVDLREEVSAHSREGKRRRLEALRAEEEGELAGVLQQRLSVMPTSYKDFKDHPTYVLERHVLTDQMLHPTNKRVVGQFKGEDVYLQEHKEKLKSFIQWRREARMVQRGVEPAKLITRLRMPGRNTKNAGKKSAAEADEEAGMDGNYEFDFADPEGKTVEIRMYGRWQTDPLTVEPIGEDGVIPMNEFGNIEVFDGLPAFVPKGAKFIDGVNAIKAAKNLNLPHVPALTGFEVRRGKFNVPVVGGVVVLDQYEAVVREAAAGLEAAEAEKAREKREKVVAEKWRKLVVGALSRQQLRVKYGH